MYNRMICFFNRKRGKFAFYWLLQDIGFTSLVEYKQDHHEIGSDSKFYEIRHGPSKWFGNG